MTLSIDQPVIHIVLIKYRSSIGWYDLQQHFTAFTALKTRCLHPDTGKPYMLSLRIGQNRSWETLAKGTTHGAVLEFATQDDLDYYLLKDPVHLAFSAKMAPLVEDVTVVDIRDGVLAGPTPRKPVGHGGVWKGTCHCGGCEWEVQSQTQMKHVLCHCDTCKKLGGGPFSCNFIVPRENLEIIKGNPGVYAYKGASGKFRLLLSATETSFIV
jgi:hypothetical protein